MRFSAFTIPRTGPDSLKTSLVIQVARRGRALAFWDQGDPDRFKFITIVGSVSHQTYNLSEPATNSTLDTVQVFWGLKRNLT